MRPDAVEETVLKIENIGKPITILQVTDIHLCECDERNPDEIDLLTGRRSIFGDALAQFDRVIAWINETKNIDLVAITGDAVDYPTEANLDCLTQRLSRLHKPWVMTFGNHEWPDDNMDNRAHWWARFSQLLHQPFEISVHSLDRLRLIFLDNSNYQITRLQLDTVRSELDRNEDCLLFAHIPMTVETLRPDTIKVWNNAITMADRDMKRLWDAWEPSPDTLAFCDVMRTHPNVRGIFSGHLHFHHDDAIGKGRRQYVTQACFLGGARLIHVVSAQGRPGT